MLQEMHYKNRRSILKLNCSLKSQPPRLNQYQQAKLQFESYEPTGEGGIISPLLLKQYGASAREAAARSELEKQRIAMSTDNMRTQISVAQSALDQARELLSLRKEQAANLRVKAGLRGILQECWSKSEFSDHRHALARVSDPTRLKADVRIAETQARDIQAGQKAVIDLRGVEIPGRVTSIDPSVVDGTIRVIATHR